MSKSQERLLAFVFGVVFVVVMLVLALAVPNPTAFQYVVFRIVLALAAAGVAAMIPGFLRAEVSRVVRAGGAMAVFVIIYFFSPAALVKSPEEVEIDEPIVSNVARHDEGLFGSFVSTANAGEKQETVAILIVKDSRQLTTPGVTSARYNKIVIDNVRALVPTGTTLVANDIEGIGQASLVGTDFSIVARRLSNVAVDASADSIRSEQAGRIRLYVKQLTNSKLSAHGKDGEPGKDGANGQAGSNGADGGDGTCGAFDYHMAHAGGDGGNGGNGENGGDGGKGGQGGTIVLTTIGRPISVDVDVSGGTGGIGGAGGEPGPPGHGGKGGAGCTGLGGSAPSKANGRDGSPGFHGKPGKHGVAGANGEYRLNFVKSFERVLDVLASSTNAQLHARLQTL